LGSVASHKWVEGEAVQDLLAQRFDHRMRSALLYTT